MFALRKNLFSQSLIKENDTSFINHNFGSPLGFHFCLWILIFFLIFISGAFIGSFSGVLSKIIATAPKDPVNDYLFLFCLFLIFIIWIHTIIKSKITTGFIKAAIGIWIVAILLIPISKSVAVGFVLFSSLAILITLLGLLFACLALLQMILLLKKYYKLTQSIFIFLLVAITVLISYFVGGSLSVEEMPLSYRSFNLLKIGMGLGVGLVISEISFSVTRYNSNQPLREDLKFLRDWALIITTWGGTSFYDLDLSSVDFSGSNLAHTDFRARKLNRTCLRNVKGLNRARVDNRYFDLENPKVQNLLTQERSDFSNFSYLNLQGAYLQNSIMHSFTFIETNLNGADFKGADLQGSILVRAEVLGADFSEANLTGVCIEDWGVNSKTLFTNVQCDYVYRKLDEQGKPTDRFPVSRNFEPREFESLYQQVGNVVELIFQEGENWQAALFSLKKLQIEDEELGLELKGIEKRGDLWVVKVTHNEAFPRQEVELRLNSAFDEMKLQLAAKEQQINRLLGIVEDQAIALKNYSKQPLGTSNSFFIVGSTITNLSASGQIDYQEAVSQVRNVVANNSNLAEANHLAQSLLTQLQNQNIALTPLQQAELIEQLILLEAQKDAFFKQIFVQQGQQFAAAMPDSAITTAVRNAIAQLTPR